MHAPFSPPISSSSSSSQSLNHIVPTSQYNFNLMPGYGAFPNPPPEIHGSAESDIDGMGEFVTEDDDNERDESRDSRGSSRETRDGNTADKRKPRVTLPRGGACVVCRNRKLKCTGERPCKSCEKGSQECRYEEVQRRKPKAVLLDERLAELERLVGLSPGEHIDNARKRLAQLSAQVSPSITSQVQDLSITHHTPSTTPLSAPLATSSGHSHSPLSLHSHRDLLQTPHLNAGPLDVPPNSPLEYTLISLILPYTPYLLMPVHPQRFMALISLPANDPSRPHPALLYIMFTEAVLVLERGTPPLKAPRPPYSLFPQVLTPPMPQPPANLEALRQHMHGQAPLLLERARRELDNGIRNVDRPFDLCRAAIGIARHLYSLGRFIEGWNIPVSRLVISCGLHRLTGNHTSPDGFTCPPDSINPIPKPYAPAENYPRSTTHMTAPDRSIFPTLRMRPVILPPARDEIEVAERTATFWSAKMQDWAAGVGWGWSISMADDECTTEWPWGNGIPEPKTSAGICRPDLRAGIRDLYNPRAANHTSIFPETTYALAIKSIALLHRASHLFDLPVASHPTPNGRPLHIPPLEAIQQVEKAVRILREHIPTIFTYRPGSHTHSNGFGSISPDGSVIESYDSFNDPWFILLHANLYTAEMMMWKEMAHHQIGAYERAVGCARAMVVFIRHMRPENWVHVDMTVALDLSLCSRFLFKESERLRYHGIADAAATACEEAESLRQALTGEYCRWMPMASLHGLIVQRVRKGWSEKEGEYERI